MKRMTNKQMEGLRRFIAQSKDASDFAKKAVILLVDESKNLTTFVYMPIGQRDEDQKEILRGLHVMVSEGRSTRLDTFLEKMVTKMIFCLYSNKIGLCLGYFKKPAKIKRVRFDKKRIEAIKLPK